MNIFKTLPENQYPYPLQDWKKEEHYSNQFDYVNITDELLQRFLKNNISYQASLKNYLTRKYRGETYTPHFNFLVVPETEFWRVDQGDSCSLNEDISDFWGWEFLRRNHAYQYAYDRYMNKENFDNEKLTLIYRPMEGFIDGFCTFINEPYIVNDDGTTFPLIKYIRDFFGIKPHKGELPNPRTKHINCYFHFNRFKPAVSELNFNNEAECQQSLSPRFKDEIVFRVHVGLPLRPQYKFIEEAMKVEAKRQGYKDNQKPNNDTFKKYIRILDAKRSGADFGEIADMIYPQTENIYPDYKGTKAVRGLYKPALEMTRKGYFRLFFSRDEFSFPKI